MKEIQEIQRTIVFTNFLVSFLELSSLCEEYSVVKWNQDSEGWWHSQAEEDWGEDMVNDECNEYEEHFVD